MSQMNQNTAPIDVRLLVRWLGIPGAIAGLKESKNCTVQALVEIARQFDLESGAKPTRKELIDDIVRQASKRIDRSLDELYSMEKDEIVHYFESAGVEPEELLDLLKLLELDPGREGRRNLVSFVASELAETGRFKRIASKGGNNHG